MDYNFKKGQRLVIELSNSDIVEGQYVDGCNNRIDIINVSCYPSRQKIKGPLLYYRPEISSVSILNETNDYNINEENNLPENVANGHTKSVSNVIGMKEMEFERLKSLSQEYIFMPTVDKRYYDAIDHINNCENVGVVGIGTNNGNIAKLSLLILSTWDQVYIFDILSYNQKKIPDELKLVLESDVIRKIIHDSRLLVDLLYSCYNTKIENIFDTEVADIMIRKRQSSCVLPENAQNLSECLEYYFNFPSTILQRAVKTDVNKWLERPLSSSRKYRAALLATYLISLKNHQEKILLEDFYKAVDFYSKSSIGCGPIKLQNNGKYSKLSEMLNNLHLTNNKQDII